MSYLTEITVLQREKKYGGQGRKRGKVSKLNCVVNKIEN